MASASKIKETLESFDSGVLDVDKLTKEVIKKKLKQSYGDAIQDAKQIEQMAEDVIKEGTSAMLEDVRSKLTEISAFVSTSKDLVVGLQSQIASIPGTVTGFAAPAAVPMVASVKSQAAAFKSQAVSILSKAASLGIDIPGIDPILDVIKTINSLV